MIWRRRGRRMDKNPDAADDDEGEDCNGNMTIQSSKAIEGINRAANHQKDVKIPVNKTTNSLLVLESALQWITRSSQSALITDPHPRPQSSRPLAQLASCSLSELAVAALTNGKYSAARCIYPYIYIYSTPPFKFFRKLVQHATKQKLTLPNSAVAISHSKNAPKRLANHHSCQPIFQLLPSQIVAKWLNSRQGCCHVAQNSKGHADHWHSAWQFTQSTWPTNIQNPFSPGPAKSDWASLRPKRPISMSITWSGGQIWSHVNTIRNQPSWKFST